MDSQRQTPHREEKSTQEAPASKKNSVEENDSIWLYDVLDFIGMSEEYRRKMQRAYILMEIISTFLDAHASWYYVGSLAEGIFTSGFRFDHDSIVCDERLPVTEDIVDARQYQFSLLIVRELHTPAGYVKLQLVIKGEPCTFPFLCNYFRKDLFKMDEQGRMVLSDLPYDKYAETHLKYKNKPALKSVEREADVVKSLRCKTWPVIAQEWLFRRRLYGWPTEDTIQEVKSCGFFLIKKGHPFSSEIDLEWRISMSLQERKLMFNLSDVHHKCYCILKMFNRDIIKMNYITSYHWKTCLFYVLEENPNNVWKKKCLYHSVNLCMNQMLKWVKIGFCPNYFIPKDNLFAGKLDKSHRSILEKVLRKLLDTGFDCLLQVKSENICEYMRSRSDEKLRKNLQAQSKEVYKQMLVQMDLRWTNDARQTYDNTILAHFFYQVSENTFTFIAFLWVTLARIHRISTVTEHTTEETKYSLSILIPYLYECLASNISAMAIHHRNLQVRYFLLFGSFICFLKGDLLGRLKLISVLYALGLYKDSEWFLDQENEDDIALNQSICTCRTIKGTVKIMTTKSILDAIPSRSNRCTCISFLPSELPIMPDAMIYEMFRYSGINIQHQEGLNYSNIWRYKAVVDYNIYFFLLKYLIKQKLERFQESEGAVKSIRSLLFIKHVIHSDVACNILAWIYNTRFMASMALYSLLWSWKIQHPLDLVCVQLTDEMKQTLYQFNAAKLHALVLLYNIWFARWPSNVYFCFGCLSVSQEKLLKCSKCKISTYCSKQCQQGNWKTHKKVCNIVRSFRST